MKFDFSTHAIREMQRRGISQKLVTDVLDKPDQKVSGYGDVLCYQSKVTIDRKIYLLRVMVSETNMNVITVYKTSKIDKYWMANI